MLYPPTFSPVPACELLASMQFADNDVLPNAGERHKRAAEATRAAILGNTYRGKLAIYFCTAEGNLHRLQSCVWAVDNDYLVLPTGASLPLRAVLRLEFS